MANTKQKVFSKDKWLETANADKAAGILTQREIDDACEIWVNDLDGKSKEEIAEKREEIYAKIDEIRSKMNI